jgi:hypothetical protein
MRSETKILNLDSDEYGSNLTFLKKNLAGVILQLFSGVNN